MDGSSQIQDPLAHLYDTRVAIRSYLYAADELATEAGNPADIRSISEHRGDVPLAHRLLVGRGTAVTRSLIWDGGIAVSADFDAGAQLLEKVLRAVVAVGPPDAGLDHCVRRTLTQLRRQRRRYLILEAGELLELDELRALATTEIPEAVARAEAALAGDVGWLADVRAAWSEHFDSTYTDSLYYSFPGAAEPDGGEGDAVELRVSVEGGRSYNDPQLETLMELAEQLRDGDVTALSMVRVSDPTGLTFLTARRGADGSLRIEHQVGSPERRFRHDSPDGRSGILVIKWGVGAPNWDRGIAWTPVTGP